MKHTNRDKLLDAGQAVMFMSGYGGSSVRDIARAASVPLGSFTNHFQSKEAFAGEILERYFAYVDSLVKESLGKTALPPLGRLRLYFDTITTKLAQDGWLRGCLIGDFGIEVSGRSEMLRAQLKEMFEKWRIPFAECIAEAQKDSVISVDSDATEIADFLLTSWEGAILRMKVDHNADALERFKTFVFEKVLI